jgi:hypothetical protein
LDKAGCSFSPYKCIVTIQNEDSLTVFWKALKHSESFSEIVDDLKRLRDRLNRNRAAQHAAELARRLQEQDDADESVASCASEFDEDAQAVVVVYVDNCCNVSRIVSSIFPGVSIKLDAFHWLKRWNEVLVEPNSAQGGIFRGLMSRALFVIDPSEFERAKEKLVRKKKREPSVKEVLRG